MTSIFKSLIISSLLLGFGAMLPSRAAGEIQIKVPQTQTVPEQARAWLQGYCDTLPLIESLYIVHQLASSGDTEVNVFRLASLVRNLQILKGGKVPPDVDSLAFPFDLDLEPVDVVLDIRYTTDDTRLRIDGELYQSWAYAEGDRYLLGVSSCYQMCAFCTGYREPEFFICGKDGEIEPVDAKKKRILRGGPVQLEEIFSNEQINKQIRDYGIPLGRLMYVMEQDGLECRSSLHDDQGRQGAMGVFYFWNGDGTFSRGFPYELNSGVKISIIKTTK